ncbi:MAG: hypothetical protein ACJARD_001631 [Alphaproteobacteria bacterium]|jgi:hypothetical protein
MFVGSSNVINWQNPDSDFGLSNNPLRNNTHNSYPLVSNSTYIDPAYGGLGYGGLGYGGLGYGGGLGFLPIGGFVPFI